jgi:hypothetical protein
MRARAAGADLGARRRGPSAAPHRGARRRLRGRAARRPGSTSSAPPRTPTASPTQCKAQLKEASAQIARFDDFVAEAVKTGTWIPSATCKTRRGAKLAENDLVASFADSGKLVEDRLLESHCAKPAR